MTRRIVLTLADDTTETHCGACPQIGEPRGHWCSIWGAMTIGRKRSPECLAAEAAASRLVEIAPEDAALFTQGLRSGPDSASATKGAAGRRIRNALREHGRGR